MTEYLNQSDLLERHQNSDKAVVGKEVSVTHCIQEQECLIFRRLYGDFVLTYFVVVLE